MPLQAFTESLVYRSRLLVDGRLLRGGYSILSRGSLRALQMCLAELAVLVLGVQALDAWTAVLDASAQPEQR